MPLEKLNFTLMFFCRFTHFECSQVPSLAGLRIFLHLNRVDTRRILIFESSIILQPFKFLPILFYQFCIPFLRIHYPPTSRLFTTVLTPETLLATASTRFFSSVVRTVPDNVTFPSFESTLMLVSVPKRVSAAIFAFTVVVSVALSIPLSVRCAAASALSSRR